MPKLVKFFIAILDTSSQQLDTIPERYSMETLSFCNLLDLKPTCFAGKTLLNDTETRQRNNKIEDILSNSPIFPKGTYF